MNKRTYFTVEVAIFAALAFVFDLLSNLISVSLWPNGGSISIAMVPVFLMAYRWGVKGGLITGLLLGLLQILSGTAYILHPVQAILDYIVAFSVIGLSGIVFKKIQNVKDQKSKIVTYALLGVLIGSSLRFVAHVIAGAVFFGSGAAEGQSVIVFSLLYNVSYMLPSIIVCGALVVLLISAAPRIFMNKAIQN